MEKITINNIIALVQKAIEKKLNITVVKTTNTIYFWKDNDNVAMTISLGSFLGDYLLYIDSIKWGVVEIKLSSKDIAIYKLLLEEVEEYNKERTEEEFIDFYNNVLSDNSTLKNKTHIVNINDLDDPEET